VTIAACRIVATLVLLNAGTGTKVQGPIAWEPAIAGYPSLMVGASITVDFDANAGLSEATTHQFQSLRHALSLQRRHLRRDAPTVILPHQRNRLLARRPHARHRPGFKGCVIAAGKINCTGTAVNFSYSNVSFINPPQGSPQLTPRFTSGRDVAAGNELNRPA